MSGSENKPSPTAINPDQLSGLLSWMLGLLSSHSFKTLDQKDCADCIWWSGGKERRKGSWETMMQWEEHLVCQQWTGRGPESHSKSNSMEDLVMGPGIISDFLLFPWAALFLSRLFFFLVPSTADVEPSRQFGWFIHWYSLRRASLVAQMLKNPPAVQETQFDPWVRMIPWRMAWEPTPVFLPGESSLADCSPQGCRVRYNWVTNTHTHTHTHTESKEFSTLQCWMGRQAFLK